MIEKAITTTRRRRRIMNIIIGVTLSPHDREHRKRNITTMRIDWDNTTTKVKIKYRTRCF